MSRLSINEVTTYRWTFEEDVTHYKAAGVQAIGVWRDKLSDFGEEKGIELLKEAGLAVSNLLWAGGFTGSDGRSYRESVQDAVEAIRLAGALRAGCLVVYSGARGGHTFNHARRLLIDALDKLLPFADEHGVTLALEPMHPGCAAEWTFLNTLDDALNLVTRYPAPRVGLVFDTYQWGFDPATLALIPRLAERIRMVQLGDGRQPPQREQNRARLGTGVVPLSEIIAALQHAGYTGDYDVELLGEDVDDTDYHELIRHSQQAFAQLCNGSHPPTEVEN